MRVRCYAEGRPGRWEAFCVDLDIAVTGRSFQEVYNSLREAVCDYVDYVRTLPEEEQSRLLNRRMPLSERLNFVWRAIQIGLFARKHDNDNSDRHEFTMPCAA